jgi:hypothetical protein
LPCAYRFVDQYTPNWPQLSAKLAEGVRELKVAILEIRRNARRSVRTATRQLEKQEAGGPHRRRAAEPGKDDLGDNRLHLKEQEGA